MKLLKVSVPNFRNLQNVELTFEPDLTPAVFPIASQNGGGKSTLLQLIFTLFYCSVDERKQEYIENLLLASKIDFTRRYKGYSYNIAKIKLLEKENLLDISFEVISEKKYSTVIIDDISKYYSIFYDAKSHCNNLEIQLISKQHIIEKEIYNKEIQLEIQNINQEIDKYNDLISEALIKIEQFKKKFSYLAFFPIHKLEKQKNLNSHERKQLFFCCKLKSEIEYNTALDIFNYASNHIFLAAPTTQTYLFLDFKLRKNIFYQPNLYFDYLFKLKECRLYNLYFYNSLTIQEISETFNSAIQKDYNEAVNNINFMYGSNFQNLIDDFHNFIGYDKYILPTPELNSIIVQKQISSKKRIELELEDLSHGELRRLGLYAWIKYNIPENSIILIDEVENALHPDWQYNIVDELASWGNNQYLLATHSFHLCEALTPKHVKEIEPKMCKPASEALD